MIVMPLEKVLADFIAYTFQKPAPHRALIFPLEFRVMGKQTLYYFSFIAYRPGIGRMIIGGKFIDTPIPTDRDILKWNLYCEKHHSDRKCIAEIVDGVKRRFPPGVDLEAQFTRYPYAIPVHNVYVTETTIHLEELPIFRSADM